MKIEQFCQLAHNRKTTKTIGDPSRPIVIESSVAQACDELVRQAIAASGWAPFHFARNADATAEPWRVTVLWHKACRDLASEFPRLFPDLKPGNKIPGMLAACGAVLLVTEVPNTPDEIPDSVKLQQVNYEHTLAVGAMIQTLLLALESAGLSSYWSSGGQLGSAKFFELLRIPPAQKLAGAIFVGYPLENGTDLERIGGGNRSKRQAASGWTREIDAWPPQTQNEQSNAVQPDG